MSTSKSLPTWVVYWLALSTPIVIWDALFVLCRPASFPDNALGMIWSPAYRIYLAIDHGYADLSNHFVEAVATMSLLEACIVAIALLLNRAPSHSSLPHLLVVVVTCLTGAKTILFFLYEGLNGWTSIAHNDPLPLIAGYIVPNGLWVIIPLLAAVATGRDLLGRGSPPA